MKTNHLDEMQVQAKNKIGNQSFQLMFYLLLFDVALYGFGFRWVAYPANTMIIATVCCGIYLLRIVLSNSVVGPSAKKNRPLFVVILLGLGSMAIAALLARTLSTHIVTDPADSSAVPLMIASVVSIVIVSTVFLIKRLRDKEE